jgi:hypothetical protein
MLLFEMTFLSSHVELVPEEKQGFPDFREIQDQHINPHTPRAQKQKQ